MTDEEILRVFGPGTDREYLHGGASHFISEVVERFAHRGLGVQQYVLNE